MWSRLGCLLSILAVALTPLLLLSAVAAGQLATYIYITGSGVVTVNMTVPVTPGVNAIAVPTPAIPATITVYVDGRLVPPVYENNTIYVFANNSGIAVVSYIANTSRVGRGIFRLDVLRNATIVVDENVILLNIPEKLLSAEVRDSKLYMVVEGGESILYTVKANVSTKTLIATRVTTTTMTAGTVSRATTASKTVGGSTTAPAPVGVSSATTANYTTMSPTRAGSGKTSATYYAAAIAAAILALVLAYMFWRRGGRHSSNSSPSGGGGGSSSTVITLEAKPLTDVDEAIISALRRAGGVLRQADLVKQLGYPRTTVIRHLRKLERMGIVRIERGVDGSNIVRLIGG